jgi:hypothetical protein
MRSLIRPDLVVVGTVVLTGAMGGGDAAGDDAAEIARLRAELEQLRSHPPDLRVILDALDLRPQIPEQPEARIIDFEPPAARQ